MAGVASVAWLRKRGVGVVNRIGSSSIWSWGVIFTLHWGKGELEQLDELEQRQRRVRTTWQCGAGWYWIIIIDNWSISTKQNELSECFL